MKSAISAISPSWWIFGRLAERTWHSKPRDPTQAKVRLEWATQHLLRVLTQALKPMPGGVVFSQVVKTAQSRGRTGRTLLKAVSQLLKPRGVAFLGRKPRKGPSASVYFHCGTAYAMISALRRRPRGAQECCGQRYFVTVTFPFSITESSCRQALMHFRRLAADARVESAGARPSRAVVARRR